VNLEPRPTHSSHALLRPTRRALTWPHPQPPRGSRSSPAARTQSCPADTQRPATCHPHATLMPHARNVPPSCPACLRCLPRGDALAARLAGAKALLVLAAAGQVPTQEAHAQASRLLTSAAPLRCEGRAVLLETDAPGVAAAWSLG